MVTGVQEYRNTITRAQKSGEDWEDSHGQFGAKTTYKTDGQTERQTARQTDIFSAWGESLC